MKKEELLFLPIALNVTGKKILLIGGGKVATHKAQLIYRHLSDVTVVSPEFSDEMLKLPFTFVQKEYAATDLNGFFLVYVCTGNRELNHQIKQDAEKAGILTSVCDDPMVCDFVSPAIHQSGHINIAVTSNAQDVMQSIHIRNQITKLIENGTIHLTQSSNE